MKCRKCGYDWEPRVSEPKECPRCKARLDIGAPHSHLRWAGAVAVAICLGLVSGIVYLLMATEVDQATVRVGKGVHVYGAGIPQYSGIENVYIVKATHGAGWSINFGANPENVLGVITASGGSTNIPYNTPFVIVIAVKGSRENMAYVVKENLKVELAVSGSFSIPLENSPDSREYVFEQVPNVYIRVNAVWDNNGNGYILPPAGSITLDPIRLWCWG